MTKDRRTKEQLVFEIYMCISKRNDSNRIIIHEKVNRKKYNIIVKQIWKTE